MLKQVRLFSIVVGVSILLSGCKDLDLNDITGFLNGNSSGSETTSSTQFNLSTETDSSSDIAISDTVTETSIRSDVSELYEKVKNFVEPKKKKIEKNKKSSKKKKKKKSNSNKVKVKKAKSSKKKKTK